MGQSTTGRKVSFSFSPAAAVCTVEACLGVLLGFLQDRGISLTESSHLCCWYLLVFAEQDDDMMEAAKTLLALYLRNNRCGKIIRNSVA